MPNNALIIRYATWFFTIIGSPPEFGYTPHIDKSIVAVRRTYFALVLPYPCTKCLPVLYAPRFFAMFIIVTFIALEHSCLLVRL